MKQYWARHQGLTRWGVRTARESANERENEQGAGLIFVWADKLVLDAGSLVFMRDDGTIQGAIAPGRWDAVFEAGPDDHARVGRNAALTRPATAGLASSHDSFAKTSILGETRPRLSQSEAGYPALRSQSPRRNPRLARRLLRRNGGGPCHASDGDLRRAASGSVAGGLRRRAEAVAGEAAECRPAGLFRISAVLRRLPWGLSGRQGTGAFPS